MYQTNYQIRYGIPKIQQQTEVAVITACQDIFNEAPSAPDHANRLAWAQWANVNTSLAAVYFLWPVGMNASIIASVETDPTGASVPDSDIQFVINSALPKVIADCLANPPSGFNPPSAS